jgi:hypothetical protein
MGMRSEKSTKKDNCQKIKRGKERIYILKISLSGRSDSSKYVQSLVGARARGHVPQSNFGSCQIRSSKKYFLSLILFYFLVFYERNTNSVLSVLFLNGIRQRHYISLFYFFGVLSKKYRLYISKSVGY